MLSVRTVRSEDVPDNELTAIHTLLLQAFKGDFTDDDWDHALGGWHVIATDGAPMAHAAVVERTLEVGRRKVRTGYVEGVAAVPTRQREGLGTAVMAQVAALVEAEFEMGALSTAHHRFYERLGWESWQGPTFVRHGKDLERTPHEDDGVMVLRFGPTADLGLALPIVGEDRPGEAW